MLGSVADAEDMLQETFIRWQQAPEQEIRSPRAFLITIISRLCINYLQSARAQREQYVGQWLPELIVTAPGSDPLENIRLDESLSIAFLLMLERLTPVERAVFRSARGVRVRVPRVGHGARRERGELPANSTSRQAACQRDASRFKASQRQKSELLEGFLQAAKSGDLEGLVALLADDVVLHSDGGGKAVSAPNLIRGAKNVARGALGTLQKLMPKNLVFRLAQVNGEPGIVSYLEGKPFSVLTLVAGEGHIQTIYVLTNPEKLAHVPDLPGGQI